MQPIQSALPTREAGTKIASTGALVVEVRIRFGTGIARFAPGPMLTLDLPSDATVDDVFRRLAASDPELDAALQSAVPIIGGAHVGRGRRLTHGEELALLRPISGG
jgi:molybdopterin converting factor small subunit